MSHAYGQGVVYRLVEDVGMAARPDTAFCGVGRCIEVVGRPCFVRCHWYFAAPLHPVSRVSRRVVGRRWCHCRFCAALLLRRLVFRRLGGLSHGIVDLRYAQRPVGLLVVPSLPAFGMGHQVGSDAHAVAFSAA